MATLYPIVEGHGEVAAVPVLLRRMHIEIAPETPFTCLPAHRLPRDQLTDVREFGRALTIAARRLRADTAPSAILLLMDADEDCPKALREGLIAQHSAVLADTNLAIVFAVREFEAWFLAANMAPSDHPDIRADRPIIENPEQVSDAKGVFRHQCVVDGAYRPRADQVRFASTMNLATARRASSFDKLWRDLEALLRP